MELARYLSYAVCVCICPGLTMVIAPPHAHWHVHDAVNAGAPLIITVGDPGAHGATVIGMHG